MRYLFLCLCLALPLTAKIRFLSFHYNESECIELQEKMFQKFIRDDYELILLNDTSVAEALERFGYGHDDLIAVVRGDFFPIRPVYFRELFKEDQILTVESEEGQMAPCLAFDPRKIDLRERGGAVKKYDKKNSADLHFFPSEQLANFGFNPWEAKLIKALPHRYNVEFHLENRFLCLADLSADSQGAKEKLRWVNACIKNKRIDQFDQPTDLKKIFGYYSKLPSKDCDIGEHLPKLAELASECTSVTEIGLGYSLVSTWGILWGLKCNNSLVKSYLGVDISQPQSTSLNLAKEEALKQGISFRFLKEDDLKIELEPVEFLFIDSMHTYCHLMYELEHFSPLVQKYIALHDTSEPWGASDDSAYSGDYSEYPASYSREKKGLWPAVIDFLEGHPEWELQERYLNCHGFTVLKRVHD